MYKDTISNRDLESSFNRMMAKTDERRRWNLYYWFDTLARVNTIFLVSCHKFDTLKNIIIT